MKKNVTLSMIYVKVREYYTIIVLCTCVCVCVFFFFGYERKCNGKQHFFVLGSLFSYTIRHFDIMQILKKKKRKKRKEGSMFSKLPSPLKNVFHFKTNFFRQLLRWKTSRTSLTYMYACRKSI